MLTEDSDGITEIVTMEAGGVLVGADAEAVKKHVKLSWERGQQVVELIREALPEELRGVLVPMKRGGVNFMKMLSTMNDCCAAAQLTAKKMVELKDEAGIEAYGEEGWRALPDSATMCLSFLCGNHIRGFPIDEFNRGFEVYMHEELGEEFKAARATAGEKNRLEVSGVSFLRSVCKLAYDGHLCYAKGNGREIQAWIKEHYPEVGVCNLERAENSKRQDWSPEVANKILRQLDALTENLVGTIVQDANILKDSTLQRMEMRQCGACVHVLALTWVVCFEELRALTNATLVDLNPNELHCTFDQLHAFALVLMGDDPLSVLAPDYRPWPKVRPGNPAVEAWCAKREERHQKELQEILDYRSRHDGDEYLVVMKKVLSIMGKSIHTSLHRTLSHYLEVYDGDLAPSKQTDAEAALTSKLKCENDTAERCFAVLRDLHKRFPSMSLQNLMGVSLARLNKTFKSADRNFAGGIAVTSDPILVQLIHTMCSVRAHSLGAIAKIYRMFQADDFLASAEHMAAHEQAKVDKGIRLASFRANKTNAANEVVLCETEARLEAELTACGKFKKAKVDFLKSQATGRINRGRTYPTVPMQYRQKNGKKVKVTPPKDAEVEYLKGLVLFMMSYDSSHAHEGEEEDDVVCTGYLRSLPPISLANTFKTSMQHRGALDKKIAEKVEAVDDPVLLKFVVKDYRGKLLYDDDSDGHYILTEANLVEWAKHQCWSATSAPVENKSGHWVVCVSAIAGGEPGACVYHHSSL